MSDSQNTLEASVAMLQDATETYGEGTTLPDDDNAHALLQAFWNFCQDTRRQFLVNKVPLSTTNRMWLTKALEPGMLVEQLEVVGAREKKDDSAMAGDTFSVKTLRSRLHTLLNQG